MELLSILWYLPTHLENLVRIFLSRSPFSTFLEYEFDSEVEYLSNGIIRSALISQCARCGLVIIMILGVQTLKNLILSLDHYTLPRHYTFWHPSENYFLGLHTSIHS